MDPDWMRQQLEAFDYLAMRYENSIRPGDYTGDQVLSDQLHRAEPAIKQTVPKRPGEEGELARFNAFPRQVS